MISIINTIVPPSKMPPFMNYDLVLSTSSPTEDMSKQSLHRRTLLRLLLRVNPALFECVLSKCFLARESVREGAVCSCVEEIINVDPHITKCLPKDPRLVLSRPASSKPRSHTFLHCVLLSKSSSMPTSRHNRCQLARSFSFLKYWSNSATMFRFGPACLFSRFKSFKAVEMSPGNGDTLLLFRFFIPDLIDMFGDAMVSMIR